MEEKQNSLKSEANEISTNGKKRSKIKFAAIVVIIVVLIGCVLSLLFLWYGGFFKEFICNSVRTDSYIWNKFSCSTVTSSTNSDSTFPLEKTNQNSLNTSTEDTTIQSIIESTSPAVVGIGLIGSTGAQDQIIGTGFVISKAGLIVTNRHVVETESEKYYMVFKDGKDQIEIDSANIFRDPVNDIALIKVKAEQIPSGIKAIPLGDSDVLKLGQTVIAIGNPLGEYSGTVTKGIISGLNREVTITKGFFNSQNEIYSDVIQTDAAINPGNSGGPMININGEVIGINFATIEGASNLSFALPINRIKSRISELEKNGKFTIPYLGVEYQSKVVFIKNQSLIGAEIINVIKDSPADAAGIKTGDIIVQFNGSGLDTSTLLSLIQKAAIGSKVEVQLLRNNVEKTVEVVIGQR